MLDHQEAMVKSLVAVAWADGRIDGEENEVIEALISSFALGSEDANKIREFAKVERTLDDVPLTELSTDDRRLLLQHAVIVTFIDGKQSDKEVEVLHQLAKRLHVPEAETEAVLSVAAERAKKLLSLL